MAPHSSTLAWKIPWMEEPGRLQSMGSRGVGHDWVTSLSLFTFMHWRRKWHPTPVFLPGESQGRGAWWAAVYGATQSRTLQRSCLENPRDGGAWWLPSLGPHRVGHDWSDLAAATCLLKHKPQFKHSESRADLGNCGTNAIWGPY